MTTRDSNWERKLEVKTTKVKVTESENTKLFIANIFVKGVSIYIKPRRSTRIIEYISLAETRHYYDNVAVYTVGHYLRSLRIGTLQKVHHFVRRLLIDWYKTKTKTVLGLFYTYRHMHSLTKTRNFAIFVCCKRFNECR